jgi:hypothetical protein
MPRLQSETFGSGDQSWLGSSHGIHECRTETLDISAWTAGTHYPNGYIPSGTPCAKVGGVLVPYTVAEGTTTGAGVLAGFLYTDQPVVPATGVGAADFAVPLLDHGRVKAAKVPYASFVAPAAAAKNAATTFVFI